LFLEGGLAPLEARCVEADFVGGHLSPALLLPHPTTNNNTAHHCQWTTHITAPICH
jgi:hypothetical protein